MSHLIQELNDKQTEAVLASDGPVLVIAGAGSGKTKALTHRIAYLINEKKVSPWNILAVTFTNKAAAEMKERLAALLKSQTINEVENIMWEDFFADDFQLPMPVMGTFHSICVRLLRKYVHLLGYENSFTIYDTADQKILAKRLMEQMRIDPKRFPPRSVLSRISNAKNELMSWQDFAEQAGDNYFTEQVARFYEQYQKALQMNNALDFDDLIMLTVQLFQQHPEVLEKIQDKFRYISVDEYQDTNHAQYILVNLLASKYRNLCVIGDSDQSIYSWRGADIRNILNFEKDYPEAKVIALEQNYRSTQIILDASNAVISRNSNRREKKLWTERTGGTEIQVAKAKNEREEAVGIVKEIQRLSKSHELPDYSDFVVLYRTNAQSRVLEEAFLRFGIPYKIIGGIKFYERKEIKDLLAYVKAIVNPHDSVSLLRILNVPARKIGPKTIEVVNRFAGQNNMSFFSALEKCDEIESLNEGKKKVLKKFTELVRKLQKVNTEFPAAGVIKHIIDLSGYKEYLNDGTVEGESRLENIQELISVAAKYNALEPGLSLRIFLEEVALIADVDRMDEKEKSVTLMTIHSAKGLEFPVVFICGLEEGIFPHSRSLLNEQELAEERRLMYVAMTRAKERLYLLHAAERLLYGEYKHNIPSQFIDDIPEELLEYHGKETPKRPNLGLNRETKEFAGKKFRYFDPNMLGRRPIPHEGPAKNISKEHSDQTAGVEYVMDEDQAIADNQMPTQVYDEPTIDIYADLDESPHFKPGSRVNHQKFGDGTVLNVTGGIVTIKFDRVQYGVKKLALSVAPIKLI